MKQKIKKELKFYGRKAITALVMAIVFVTVAGTSIWALAAFTEPTDTPSNSVQDWAKNIMGANNSDNAFDSSSVTANSDGSVVERLESLENKSNGGVTALSALSPYGQSLYAARKYCVTLSATAEHVINGSDTATTYTDWRLGEFEEYSPFIGISGSYMWTKSSYWKQNYYGYTFIRINLSDGAMANSDYSSLIRFRCIR